MLRIKIQHAECCGVVQWRHNGHRGGGGVLGMCRKWAEGGILLLVPLSTASGTCILYNIGLPLLI